MRDAIIPGPYDLTVFTGTTELQGLQGYGENSSVKTDILCFNMLYNLLFTDHSAADPSCREVLSVGLRPFDRWDCGFESR